MTNLGEVASNQPVPIGALEGVFPSLNLNGVLAPQGTGFLGSGGSILVAGRAYYGRFVAPRSFTAKLIAFVTTVAATGNDECDVGLYDATGKRLSHSGAKASKLNATAGVQTIEIPETSLVAGTVYYAAFSVVTPFGGTGATLVHATGGAGAGDIFGTAVGTRLTGIQASAHPLPETATLSSGQTVPLLAVRSS